MFQVCIYPLRLFIDYQELRCDCEHLKRKYQEKTQRNERIREHLNINTLKVDYYMTEYDGMIAFRNGLQKKTVNTKAK